MGMDVYGKQPTSETGRYFRLNVWHWRPLADYARSVAPSVASRCKHWQTNDGDGLNAADALRLAQALQEELDGGRCEAYATIRAAELAAIPNQPCDICGGTGKRLPPPVVGPGDQPCNGCNSTGSMRPFSTLYPFHVETVQEFVAFLRDCGGFEIF